jgi:hypothetical protein
MNITTSQSTRTSDWSAKAILVALVTVTAVVICFTGSYRASNFDIVPDSVEYAVGAHHIATDGSYYISINGRHYPPRYQPWFSMLILAPSYTIFGTDPGNAIYAVLFLAIAGVIAAFLAGNMISGLWGGVLSAAILLLVPSYREHAKLIMTDVPCTALVLVTSILYLKSRQSSRWNLLLFGLAGITSGLCIALRPACGGVLLPFILMAILHRENKIESFVRIVLVSLPSIAVTVASLIYNSSIFGSPLRNGYNFWCPVPYDYRALTFSAGYLFANVKMIIRSPLSILLPAAIILFMVNRRYRPAPVSNVTSQSCFRHFVEFTVASTLPLIVLHLLYFYQITRFYLPVVTLLAVIVGSLIARWLEPLPKVLVTVTQAILVVAAVVFRILVPDQQPLARIIAGEIANSTPGNSMIITSIDPVFLDFYVGKSARRQVVPLTRYGEYASKVICARKVVNPDPAPTSWWDHRCQGLIKAGAKEVIPLVASEGISILTAEAGRGRPLFLEASRVHEWDMPVIDALKDRFDVSPHSPYLFRLTPKKPLSSLPADGQRAAQTGPPRKSGKKTSPSTKQ